MSEFDYLDDDDDISGVDIVGLDPDMQALVDDMMDEEGISGDDGGDEDFDLDDISGEVEIGRGRMRRRLTASAFRGLIRRRTRKAAKMGARKALSRVARSRRPAVTSSAPTNAETAILAFQRDAGKGGLIAAGAAGQVVAEPQDPFKPEALIIDEAIAPDFLITEIKIGTKPLFVNTGGVPASMFKADGVLGRLLLNKTGQVSQQLVLSVQNISTSARPFYAAMVGWSAK